MYFCIGTDMPPPRIIIKHVQGSNVYHVLTITKYQNHFKIAGVGADDSLYASDGPVEMLAKFVCLRLGSIFANNPFKYEIYTTFGIPVHLCDVDTRKVYMTELLYIMKFLSEPQDLEPL